MKNKKADSFDIEAHTISGDISHRGGSLKVNVSSLFPEIAEAEEDGRAIMGAYQNYLGGGIAGAIVGASQFNPAALSKADQKVFLALKERIKRHFYAMNQGGGDEYMVENVNSFDRNQKLPVSGY
jgi:hypothetical protein